VPYPIDLTKSILDATVTRDFMSHRFGGSNCSCFPRIKQERVDEHGYNDFMYLNLDLNPHAPQVPGAPGLYFEPGKSDPDFEWADPQRLYSRITGGAWQKMGIYQMTRSSPLSIEELARGDMRKVRFSSRILTKKVCSSLANRC